MKKAKDEVRVNLNEIFAGKSIPVIINRNYVRRHLHESKLDLNEKGISKEFLWTLKIFLQIFTGWCEWIVIMTMPSLMLLITFFRKENQKLGNAKNTIMGYFCNTFEKGPSN